MMIVLMMLLVMMIMLMLMPPPMLPFCLVRVTLALILRKWRGNLGARFPRGRQRSPARSLAQPRFLMFS